MPPLQEEVVQEEHLRTRALTPQSAMSPTYPVFPTGLVTLQEVELKLVAQLYLLLIILSQL